MSRRIAAHFGSMAAIRAADADVLAQVDGIGVEKARVIVAELAELAPLIDKLIAQNVGTAETAPAGAIAATAPDAQADGPTAAAPLAGEVVVVTGSMTGALAALSRNEMNELVERAGGKASGSVSKKTTVLVAGEKAGSKRAKAEELGIRILTPEQFADLVAELLD
jgi:DNA ligase (NAD+)